MVQVTNEFTLSIELEPATSPSRRAVLECIEIESAPNITYRRNIDDAGFAIRAGFSTREQRRQEELGEIDMACSGSVINRTMGGASPKTFVPNWRSYPCDVTFSKGGIITPLGEYSLFRGRCKSP